MRSKGIHRVDRLAMAFLVVFASIAFVPIGCGPLESDRLVVATSWPKADRLRIEDEFADWLRTSSQIGLPSVRLEWLILTPGDNLDRLAVRRNPPDVLLGGPASTFERLGRMDRPIPPAPRRLAVMVGRARTWIRLAGSSRQTPSSVRAVKPQPTPGPAGKIGPDRADAATVTFDDPRNDPISLAWAKGLVRVVAVPGRLFPADSTGRPFVPDRTSSRVGEGRRRSRRRRPGPRGRYRSSDRRWISGRTLDRRCRHPGKSSASRSGSIVPQFLGEPIPRSPDHREPGNLADSSDLLAELLGATLVDAQDELWAAWAALEREGYPDHALRWLTEPPPWPPASVAKMMTGAGRARDVDGRDPGRPARDGAHGPGLAREELALASTPDR